MQDYEIVVLGDREFHSVELGKWLCSEKVYFVLRQKKDTFIQRQGQDYQQLTALETTSRMKEFLTDIKITKEKGFAQAAIAIYWKRKYRSKQEKEPWYLLTNLKDLESSLKAYKMRAGIEAMFSACKTGGYNLSGSGASIERLTPLVLLIAIAYTCAAIKGNAIRSSGQQNYVSRLRKVKRTQTGNSSFWVGLYGNVSRLRKVKRTQTGNSSFWVGLYGSVWIIGIEFLSDWTEKLMSMTPNKLPFFQRGLRAMSLMQSAT